MSFAALGLILLAHYAVSTFFLFFPTIIKKKIKQKLRIFKLAVENKKFLRFAHRGGPHYKLENTIPAFRNTLMTHKNEFVELDVQLTKDKQLVVYHDYELTRLFGNDIKVCDTIYLKDFAGTLKDKVKLHFNLGRFSETKDSISEIE